MANGFSVTVGQTANNKITVNAGQGTVNIALTKDLSAYYAMIAKEWAVKTGGFVEGEDYSAKHYAMIAQQIADQFGISKDEVIMALQSEGANQIAQIQEVSEPILKEIDKITPVADNITDVVNISNNIDDILNKTVDVGQTITGEEGTEAKVENVGTQFAPVLDFTIPRGDKGDDGGMDATYDEATGTLSFYKESGTVLHSKWGNISGDLEEQYDLIEKLRGYATHTDVLSAIASIPQFKLSIVDELPPFGEKMTLYLVPRTVGDWDNAYDEYVWLEDIAMFEHLGSTAVDLTDYVKKDYYGTASVAGLIRVTPTYGVQTNTVNGVLHGTTKTLDAYKVADLPLIISKGTLDNVLTQYASNETIGEVEDLLDKINGGTTLLATKTVSITEADYNALETKDANTLYLIEE